MKLIGAHGRKMLMAAGALLVLTGCKNTGYAGAANIQYYQTAVEDSLEHEDWQAGIEAIRHAPGRIDDDFVPWLEDNAERFPPIFLYAMADRFYSFDAEKATRWFFSARVRHTYDLMRCTNDSAMDRLDVFEGRFKNTVFRFVQRERDDAYWAASEGLDWDFENDLHETSPVSECHLGARMAGNFDAPPRRNVSDGGGDSEWLLPSHTHRRILAEARNTNAAEVEDIWSWARHSVKTRKIVRRKAAKMERREKTRRRNKPWHSKRWNDDKRAADRPANSTPVATGDGWRAINF